MHRNPQYLTLVASMSLILPALVWAANDISAPADVAKPPASAQKTASGLAYKVLVPGRGKQHPKLSDTVLVNYTGWTKNGKMFDSSIKRGKPAMFPLRHVIKGWQQAVQLMRVGEKARFWIPAKLAYGQHPTSGAPAGMLVFDIKLLKIKR